MNKSNNRIKKSIWIIVAVIIAFTALIYVASLGNTGKTLTITQMQDMVKYGFYLEKSENENGEIEYVSVETGFVTDIYVCGGNGFVRVENTSLNNKAFPKFADFNFTYNNTSDDLQFIEDFNMALDALANGATEYQGKSLSFNESVLNQYRTKDLLKINYSKVNPTTSFFEKALPYIVMFVIVIMVGFVIFKLFSAKGAGGNPFTKNRARMVERCSVRFDDIAGAEEEKEETREIVEFLKDPSKFKALGARIPKGVLLVGNPGTGKTLLAKAVAGESNVPFFSISGSDFVELYVGVGASRVRDLFETAKKNAPCIVFIDEIDAVGRQRGAGLGGGNDEREQTLNQMLVEMDGFDSSQGIIILAATNRADVLDPALLRPGRFDRQIYVNVPDVRGREGIIKIHAKNKPIDDDVDIQAIARLTSGFTGADIENFLNEAAILAARDNRLTITMEDITEGINKVLMGPQKKSRLVSENDRKLTAYHESGHAIIAKFMDCGDTVHEVSIIPRGMAGGYTSTRPADDDSHYSYNKLCNRICMMMGGRIAEELVFKDITAGASSDIQRATEVAKKMVSEWGMSSKLGFMSFGKGNEIFVGRDYQVQNPYSESTAKIIDDETKAILDNCYANAKKLLEEKRDLLENMADLLMKEETIYAEEVDELIAGVGSEEISKKLHEKAERRKEKELNIKKEQELIQREKMQELKIKAAAALKEKGVLGEDDYNKLLEEQKKIIKEKEDFLNLRNNKLKEKAEEKLAKQKVEGESVSSPTVNDVEKKTTKKSPSQKKSTTTKSTTEKKTTTKKSTTSKTTPKKSSTKATKTEKTDTKK